MFQIFQVCFSSVKPSNRLPVRYVIAYVTSISFVVPSLHSLPELPHDFLCTFCRRFNFLHGIFFQCNGFIVLLNPTFDLGNFIFKCVRRMSGGLDRLSAASRTIWRCTPELSVIRQATLTLCSCGSKSSGAIKDEGSSPRVYVNDKSKCI